MADIPRRRQSALHPSLSSLSKEHNTSVVFLFSGARVCRCAQTHVSWFYKRADGPDYMRLIRRSSITADKMGSILAVRLETRFISLVGIGKHQIHDTTANHGDHLQPPPVEISAFGGGQGFTLPLWYSVPLMRRRPNYKRAGISSPVTSLLFMDYTYINYFVELLAPS